MKYLLALFLLSPTLLLAQDAWEIAHNQPSPVYPATKPRVVAAASPQVYVAPWYRKKYTIDDIGDNWEGMPLSALLASWGMPSCQYKIDLHTTIFTWKAIKGQYYIVDGICQYYLND